MTNKKPTRLNSWVTAAIMVSWIFFSCNNKNSNNVRATGYSHRDTADILQKVISYPVLEDSLFHAFKDQTGQASVTYQFKNIGIVAELSLKKDRNGHWNVVSFEWYHI